MAATELGREEEDLLDAEVGEFLQNYLQLSGEARLRDSGIRLDMSDSSSDCSSSLPVTALERLIRTHPIWFLPRVDRLEAAQILHLKETGNFIVRKCSQTEAKTAISVKLGYQHGFVVDHFVIKEREGKVSLSSSSLQFDTLLSLVYHHMSQVESLPVVLALPSILRNTDTRQCLSSLALLGRDFWRYPMSNPGRQSLLIPSTTKDDTELITFTDSRIRATRVSNSPSLIRRNINLTPTTAHCARHSFSHYQHPSQSAARQTPCHTPRHVDSSDQGGLVHYFNSPTHDKISDYEDIWDKSPAPDPDLQTDEMISPTMSEQRFKNFLFNKIFDKSTSSESQYETETESRCASSPSYPTCSSSELVSDGEDSDSSSISSFSTESSEIELVDISEQSDPLAALEILTDILAEDTDDELEIFDDLDNSEHLIEESLLIVKDAVKDELQNNSNETSSEVPPDIVSDIQSGKSSNSGSFTGLLRKLSIRRKPSLGRSAVRAEKRLSAVIGCYLTPSLLTMKIDDCQIDSSSWEFLDQSKEPGKTYFSEERPTSNCHWSVSTLDPPGSPGRQEDSPDISRPRSEESNKFGSETTLRLSESEREKSNGIKNVTSTGKNDLSVSRSQSCDETGARTVNERVGHQADTVTRRSEGLSDPGSASGESGAAVIKACVRHLSSLETRFICCTVESGLERPELVMRNIRQVMTGLKNYLTITGEGDLKEVVRQSGISEVEQCLEEIMQELVVRPLRKHLHCLLLQARPGHCWQPPLEVETVAEAERLVEMVQQSQERMSEMFSAGDKLQCLEQLLANLATVFSSMREQCEALRYLVVRTSWLQAGLEAQYMWGLMSPSVETRSLWSVCMLACSVYPLYSPSPFPLLTISEDEGGVSGVSGLPCTVPCHPDITAADIISMIIRHQTKQYSLSYRTEDRDIEVERDTKGLDLCDLQQTGAVIISLRRKL